MPDDRSYIDENTREREHMRALVEAALRVREKGRTSDSDRAKEEA